MKKNRKLAVIIAAGGSSTRYKKGNKLLIPLGGVPLFIYAVREMSKACVDGEVVLVCPEADMDSFREKLSCYPEIRDVKIVEGGGDRMESVWNGLQEVDVSTDFVAVHDAARPFAGKKLVDSLLASAEIYGAVVPAKRVTDTIKMGNVRNLIEHTVDRELLWSVQTPQICRYSLLVAAYQNAMREGKRFTDEAGLLESCGQQVFLHEYIDYNIKVTYQEDLFWAEKYLDSLVSAKQERPS